MFTLGLVIGASIGITVMCLMQINKDNHDLPKERQTKRLECIDCPDEDTNKCDVCEAYIRR